MRAQQDVRALRPLAAHQAVLAQQDCAHVLGAAHADHRPAQQVRLEDCPVALPAGAVEAGALRARRSEAGAAGPRLGVWPKASQPPLANNSLLQAGAWLYKTEAQMCLATILGKCSCSCSHW